MKKITLILILLISVSACRSSRNTRIATKKGHRTTKTVTKRKSPKSTNNNNNNNNKVAKSIINYAKTFEGVRYKYGGTTKSGMDCSGLIYTAFNKENIKLPRSSSAMAVDGNWIDLKKVKEGDLLFFATRKNSRTVNHVGLVTSSRTGNVEFIHSSTSKGVIVSNLAERYWYHAFVQARRVL